MCRKNAVWRAWAALIAVIALATTGCGNTNGGDAGAGGMAGSGGAAAPGGNAGDGGTTGAAGGSGMAGSGGTADTPEATVLYDRTDPLRMSPFPDDNWLAEDPTMPTGYRVLLRAPPREADVSLLYSALMNETQSLDGFSPIGGIVLGLSDAPDRTSLPLDPAASVEPSSAISLFELTPGSETFGRRVPFELTPVSKQLPGQAIDHSLVLYPSIPLAPKGRYAVVVTRDARTVDGRAFGPSDFMSAVLGRAEPGERDEITKARALLDDGVFEALLGDDVVGPRIAATDIALAVRITIRNMDDLPRTPLSMKEQILSGPPPAYTITSVERGPGPVAAIVRGLWQAPNWREDQYFIARGNDGDPRITGSLSVPFVLALPAAAGDGPVPVVMFQHGSPGSSEQVVWESSYTLSEAGFAAIGFTDAMNRELGQDLDQMNTVLFGTLVSQWRMPHFAMQTYGDQMAFLRVIEQLGTLDRLPLPSGDGVPDLDVDAPLSYVGLSMGSVHGSGFLPYAPEIKAAAIAAGALRQGEGYFARGTFIEAFPPDLAALLTNATPTDYWVGLSILQMILDHQDPHNHAAFLYRKRLAVAGTTRKASVLLQEGLEDIPNPIRSLAWTFGPIPHLEPIQESTPVLEPIVGPVTANIDSETTAAMYQFVPVGIPGIPPTPGCAFEPVGHFCAQAAEEAQLQRALFLQSAIEDTAPTITDPLSIGP